MIPLDELEKLAKAATPGPWKSDNFDIIAPEAPTFIAGNKKIVLGNPDYLLEDDQNYIAALSPDVVLELIAEVRRYREAPEFPFVSMSEGKRLLYALKKNNESLRAQLEEAREVLNWYANWDWANDVYLEAVQSKASAYLEKYPK